METTKNLGLYYVGLILGWLTAWSWIVFTVWEVKLLWKMLFTTLSPRDLVTMGPITLVAAIIGFCATCAVVVLAAINEQGITGGLKASTLIILIMLAVPLLHVAFFIAAWGTFISSLLPWPWAMKGIKDAIKQHQQ